MSKQAADTTQTLVLGGGCFWCTEAVFARVQGVISVQSGYANGDLAEPTYEQVCSGSTGHAEVVRLRFDPAQVSARALLEVFFATHDPTTLNQQGHDVGTQYRSGIYWRHREHEAVAQALIAELTADQVFPAPIVTEVQELITFWPAEDYHQNYFAKYPQQRYCAMVVAPKLAKFRQNFARLLKPESSES